MGSYDRTDPGDLIGIHPRLTVPHGEGRWRMGIAILSIGLVAGLIDLFASTDWRLLLQVGDRHLDIGISPGPGFGWKQGMLFAAALVAVVAGLVLAYIPAALLRPRAVARRIGCEMKSGRPTRHQPETEATEALRDPAWRGRLRLYLFGAGFLLGLAIRVAFIGHHGTEDPGIYQYWGGLVADFGLASAYHADYLPLQWQVFGSISALAEQFAIRPIVMLKAVNLVCDFGSFALIVVLLQRWAINPAYALVYWLAPYVAGLDWLSYVDFQPGLFVLLAVVVVSFSNRPVDFLIAGIPLGVALLMKPQSYTLFAMLGLFVLARAVLERRIVGVGRWILLFIAPAVMVGVYSIYFWLNGRGLTFVVTSFSGQLDVQPALSAQMPNIWHIVGNFYREGGPVASVTEPAIYHRIAALATAAILTVFAFAVARTSGRRSDGINMLLLFAVGSLIVPMTMTQAHENHLFLGALFGSLLMVIARDRRFAVTLSALLLVAFVNLFAHYGFDRDTALDPLTYTAAAQLAVAVIATAIFVVMALQLARLARSSIGMSTNSSKVQAVSAPRPTRGGVVLEGQDWTKSRWKAAPDRQHP